MNNMQEIKDELVTKLRGISNLNELNDLRVYYLGKKGIVQELSKKMISMSNEEKKEYGRSLNEFKGFIYSKIEDLEVNLKFDEIRNKLEREKIDITLPGTKKARGSIHPINRVIEEIEELFISMGYDVVEGTEIEEDLYNFELLNVSKDHPARDTQDTFFITDEMLLRTQTSSIQVKTMQAKEDKGPIRIISPGKVYRRDNDDATHSHQFYQIEALVVDKDISMAHLKGTLQLMVKKLFGEDRVIRFRPSYFPFTEPSIEVDISCFKCGGEGCSICKRTGWIEILGAGMVHPNVLRMSGYDPTVYKGFAFGVGPERIAMLKYGINDIREFYTNDLRFLEQFNRVDGGDINES